MTLALVLAGIGVAVLLILDRLAAQTVRPARRSLPPRPDALGALPAPDRFEIPDTNGGPTLAGWTFPGEGGSQAAHVLGVHGWGSNRAMLLPLVKPLLPHVQALHLLDIRSHGDSDTSFPVTIRHFRDDVLSALAALQGRSPDVPWIGLGHSMGGSALMLAAIDGGRLDGLIAIASPFDIYDAIARHLVGRGMPGHMLVPVLKPFWGRHVGAPAQELHPGRRAGEFGRPSRVIQPRLDDRVPPEAGEQLARALGGDLIWVEDAGHTDVLCRPETARAAAEFVRRFLR